MRLRQSVAVFSATVLTFCSSGLSTGAQVTYPAEIRDGSCTSESIAVELSDLAPGSGETVGPVDAELAANSFSVVPLSLEILTGADHVILVSDPGGEAVACGPIGGATTDAGSLIFGLSPVEESGVSGIAVMSPATDPSFVNLSVFVAPVPELGTAAADPIDGSSASQQVDNPLAVIGQGQEAEAQPVDAPTNKAQAAQPYASGGLGLTVAAWQKEHGPGTPRSFGLAYEDGHFWALSGEDGRLIHIEQEIPAMSIEDARILSTQLMPADAQLVGSYYADFGLLVDLYYSPSLIEQIPNDDWTDAEPGNFMVIYGQYGPPEGVGPVTDLLVATGNNP